MTLTSGQRAQTAAWIADQQDDDGAIPWFAGGHLDPWDHVQAAMGLAISDHREAAARAYEWSAGAQRTDGTWAARYESGTVVEPHTDANFVSYFAVGLWHWWLVTDDADLPRRLWPTVDAAIEAVLPMQRDDGAFVWRAGESDALVTGNASIAFSLRCAMGLAGLVGADRPSWRGASEAVARALTRPELFMPKPHSMDWYYPLLGASWDADAVDRRLKEGWETFVVPGLGIRCVTPNTWVTGAESCELALALAANGRSEQARAVFDDMQHLRSDDGSYWTGLEFASQVRWPDERTTWTAATVLLADDALTGRTGGAGLFAGKGLS